MQGYEGTARCFKTRVSDPLVDLSLGRFEAAMSVTSDLSASVPPCQLSGAKVQTHLSTTKLFSRGLSVLLKKGNRRSRMIKGHSKPDNAQSRLLYTTNTRADVVMPPDD